MDTNIEKHGSQWSLATYDDKGNLVKRVDCSPTVVKKLMTALDNQCGISDKAMAWLEKHPEFLG